MNVASAIRRASRATVPPAIWPLADQGLVSVGGFVVNLTLARGMPAEQYGVYCLLLMAMLQIQVLGGSLLFYPLSVRGAVMDAEEQAELLGHGLLLAVGLTVPLGVALAAGLAATGHADLAVPAVAWLMLWQVQELLRRGLFAQMRHAAAIPGDAVRYGGQAAALIGLVATGSLTLVHAVTAMAVAAGVAAAWQAMQVRLAFTSLAGVGLARTGLAGIGRTAAGFWRVGAGSLGANLLSTLALQLYPWSLVLFGGAALVAGFQAALNVVLVVNPVLIGLGNVIPQMVARDARQGGARHAWQASRATMALGAAPVLAFYGLAAVWPQPILAVLYGHGSPYVALTLPVRIMAAASMLGFAVELVNAFLHGLQQTRLAMRINGVGLAATALLGLPLTAAMGLTGSCVGMAGASIARVVVSSRVLAGVLADASRPRR
jgi:O-antigen/teichoic acid export membrane protein